MGLSAFLSLICGKLLGDGCITKQEGRKPRFQYIHRKEDYDWSFHCYEVLKNHVPLNPPKYRKIFDHRLAKGYSESYVVQSRTHPLITELYSIWYPEGKKEIPFDFLEKYLDERTLAWWYQDDGHLKIVKETPQKIILSTDGFIRSENQYLCKLLYDRFSLRFSIDGQNRIILYDQIQILYFLRLIKPWTHTSMVRKFITNNPQRNLPQRTTIYLPKEILLTKPTKEINDSLENLKHLSKLMIETTNNKEVFIYLKELAIKEVPTKPYQIKINPEHGKVLMGLKYKTGLTISSLVAYCFRP